MTLLEFEKWAAGFLHPESFSGDISLNGIQVQNRGPDKKQIKKAAFAVDACLETIEKAAAEGADILFVHHGLFWGSPLAVTGCHYDRVRALMDADMALYACHIPLDANPEYGNNYGLARQLGLKNLEPFGEWRGMTVGVRGVFEVPVSTAEIAEKLVPAGEKCNAVLPFGPEKNNTAAIITGDGGSDAEAAADAGVDVFITGEAGHTCYHMAKERGMNLIAAGHYNTETVGVSLVMNKLMAETDIEAIFIPAPTGL